MIGRGQVAGAAAIAAAFDAGEPIAGVLIVEAGASESARAIAERADALGIPVFEESAREMRRMRSDESDADVLAVTGPRATQDLETLMARDGLVLLLAGLRYPANVGFLLRSVEVAGAEGVVIDVDWTESVFAEAERISIRAQRFLSVVGATAERAVEAARAAGRRVVAVETEAGVAPWQVDLTTPALLVLGSETDGIPMPVLEAADERVRIPVRGFIPSYNVQAAAGIVLGEWLRQTSDT